MALRGESAEVVRRHRAWLDRVAEELAAEMYGPDGMPWGTPFAELEIDAVELCQALARRVMRRVVDAQAEDVPEEAARCPGCGRALEPPDEADESADAREGRSLTTLAGEVAWAEPRRDCRKCRRAFFPSVEGAGDRPRPAQPARATADRLRGGEGAVPSGQ